MKKVLVWVACVFFYSCGLFTNHSDNRRVMNMNRDYNLINKTLYNNLKIFVSRINESNCAYFSLVATLGVNASYPFHVNPGETVYVRYCTTQDVFCSGCRLIKLIGNSQANGNDVDLVQNPN